MNSTIIKTIIKSKATKSGNSSHIIIPKQYEGKEVFVLVIGNSIVPRIDKNRKRMIGNKKYIFVEITSSKLTSGFWIEEKRAKELVP